MSEWEQGVSVSIRRMRRKSRPVIRDVCGWVSEANFEMNLVLMDLEDGGFWQGTSQEFDRVWEVAP